MSMFSSGTRSGRSFPVSEFGIGSELEKFGWVAGGRAGDLARSQLAEQDEGSGVLAMEAGLMAAQGIETAGGSGGMVLIQGGLQGGVLNSPDMQEAPAADGDVADQMALDFVLGIELALHGLGESGERFEIFVFERDGAGG